MFFYLKNDGDTSSIKSLKLFTLINNESKFIMVEINKSYTYWTKLLPNFKVLSLKYFVIFKMKYFKLEIISYHKIFKRNIEKIYF